MEKKKKNPLPALFQLQLGYPGNVNWVLLLTFMTLSHRKQGRKYHKSVKLTSVQQWERRAGGNRNPSKHPTVPPVSWPYGWKWLVILVASLRKIHRNELRWESNLKAQRTPINKLGLCSISLSDKSGNEWFSGKRVGGRRGSGWTCGEETEGVVLVGCMSYLAGQFSNLMRNQM